MKLIMSLVLAGFLILGCLLIGCYKNPLFSNWKEVVIDNRTPFEFMVIVDDNYRGDLKGGCIYSITITKDEIRNLQLRSFGPGTPIFKDTLTIISTNINFNIKKIYLTVDDKGNIRMEFVIRGEGE